MFGSTPGGRGRDAPASPAFTYGDEMTTQAGAVVRLSGGDWIKIGAGLITVLSVATTAYLRQDRMLSELVAIQQQQQQRLVRLENQMDYLTRTRP